MYHPLLTDARFHNSLFDLDRLIVEQFHQSQCPLCFGNLNKSCSPVSLGACQKVLILTIISALAFVAVPMVVESVLPHLLCGFCLAKFIPVSLSFLSFCSSQKQMNLGLKQSIRYWVLHYQLEPLDAGVISGQKMSHKPIPGKGCLYPKYCFKLFQCLCFLSFRRRTGNH